MKLYDIERDKKNLKNDFKVKKEEDIESERKTLGIG